MWYSRERNNIACPACIPRAQKIRRIKCLLKGAYRFQSTIEAKNSWIVILALFLNKRYNPRNKLIRIIPDTIVFFDRYYISKDLMRKYNVFIC